MTLEEAARAAKLIDPDLLKIAKPDLSPEAAVTDPTVEAGRPLATCVGGGDPYGAIAAAAQGAAAAVSSPMAVAARQASGGASTEQFSALTIPAGGTITLTGGAASAQMTF